MDVHFQVTVAEWAKVPIRPLPLIMELSLQVPRNSGKFVVACEANISGSDPCQRDNKTKQNYSFGTQTEFLFTEYDEHNRR
jgi:hypothetical protein